MADFGADSGSRPTDRANSAVVSTKGFDPGELEILERAIDRMGWPEIHAFQNELRKGQDVYEDAGGYFMRAIKALFGIKSCNPVLTYREAARAMMEQAKGPSGA